MQPDFWGARRQGGRAQGQAQGPWGAGGELPVCGVEVVLCGRLRNPCWGQKGFPSKGEQKNTLFCFQVLAKFLGAQEAEKLSSLPRCSKKTEQKLEYLAFPCPPHEVVGSTSSTKSSRSNQE